MADAVRINLSEKLSRVSEHWSPKLVETLDDYEVKVVKIKGDFVWHKHAADDEMFIVLKGGFRMDFRDRQVALNAGEMIVVPRGVEHKPFAAEECEIMLLERRGVVNTGDAERGDYTRDKLERI